MSHNPQVCLACGEQITPDQPEIRVEMKSKFSGYPARKSKPAARYRHENDADCAAAWAHTGDKFRPFPRDTGRHRAAAQALRRAGVARA